MASRAGSGSGSNRPAEQQAHSRPFDRDNEFHLQWIGLADWEYQTTFQLDAAALAHDHLDLVFDGLDTFADVLSE